MNILNDCQTILSLFASKKLPIPTLTVWYGEGSLHTIEDLGITGLLALKGYLMIPYQDYYKHFQEARIDFKEIKNTRGFTLTIDLDDTTEFKRPPDCTLRESIQKVIDDLGPWASAAQDDPRVCEELKTVFKRVLNAGTINKDFD